MLPSDPPESLINLQWIIITVLVAGYPALIAYIAKLHRDERNRAEEQANAILDLLRLQGEDIKRVIAGLKALSEGLKLDEKYSEIAYALRDISRRGDE